MKLQKVDGVPDGVKFQILSGTTLPEIQEQDFSAVEFLHVGHAGLTAESLTHIINVASNLKTIRLAQKSFF